MNGAGSLVAGDASLVIDANSSMAEDATLAIGVGGSMTKDTHCNWCRRSSNRRRYFVDQCWLSDYQRYCSNSDHQ